MVRWEAHQVSSDVQHGQAHMLNVHSVCVLCIVELGCEMLKPGTACLYLTTQFNDHAREVPGIVKIVLLDNAVGFNFV